MENFSEQNVNIQFPKFKYEYEIKLNDVLSEMGMELAFSPYNADFTGINRNGHLYIDYVKHKSFIEVDEEGTEAAAVTVVAIDYTSVGSRWQHSIYCEPSVYVCNNRKKHRRCVVYGNGEKSGIIEFC